MANSAMTFVYDDGFDGSGMRCAVRKITASWLSDDAAGTVSATTRKISGVIIKGVTDPGSPAPTANYDIAITDEDSVNVLTACDDDLADRHTTTTEEVYFLVKDHAGTPAATGLYPAVCSPLTISISNAGNAKAGTLTLYYRSM